MSISFADEQILSLAEAAKRLPARRAGKRPDVSCLCRCTQLGVRGIRLESLMVGGTRCTSLEALQRFFDALTAAAESQAAPTPQAPRLSARRRREIEAAERRLAKAGV